MNYLQSYKTFEMAVIRPWEMDSLIDRLIQERPRNIQAANQISEEYGVDIVTYDQFVNSIEGDMKEGVPPKERFMFGPPPGFQPPPGAPTPPSSGLHFAVMNKYTNKMNLVVSYSAFMNFLTRMAPPQLKEVIKSIMGHENIHFQQFQKMGGDPEKYVVDSPVKNIKGYLGHFTELMAHAYSIVDELKREGISKEEILSIISTYKGRSKNHILDDYRRTFDRDSKELKQLRKYMFQYVEELFPEPES